MGELTVVALCVFAVCALVGGIRITAVGPGGVLPTIGLFALTTFPPATIAGTAAVTLAELSCSYFNRMLD